MLLLGEGWHSGGLRVGGGQVFMLEILNNLLGQFCQHSFGQGLFCRLQGRVESEERGLLGEVGRRTIPRQLVKKVSLEEKLDQKTRAV